MPVNDMMLFRDLGKALVIVSLGVFLPTGLLLWAVFSTLLARAMR